MTTNYMTEEGELISRKTLPAELVAKLKQPLPPEAVKPHPTKPYLSTIKVPFVVERLNDVFGLGGWDVANEIIESTEMVVVKSTLTVPEYGIRVEQFGGNDNTDRGDAYKGACTDALSKIGSYLYIGMDVYKGLRDEPQAPRAPKAESSSRTSTAVENVLAIKVVSVVIDKTQYGFAAKLGYYPPNMKQEATLNIFSNKDNKEWFPLLKGVLAKEVVFKMEKKGKYTNAVDLISIDGTPRKTNGTMPPVAVEFSDGTQITDNDIPF